MLFTGLPLNSRMTSPSLIPAWAAGPSSVSPAIKAPLVVAQAEPGGDVVGNILDANADPAAMHLVEAAELLDDRHRDLHGTAKPMPI